MAKASDNVFPKLLIAEGAAPADPAAGNQALFVDSTDHKLKRIDASGTVTTVEGSTGGGSGGGSLSGTYAARPAANTVASGTVYYATDVPEGYRSDGTSWSVIPCGGSELGYTQLTSSFTTAAGPTGTAWFDITGLSVTIKVGERPIMVRGFGMFRTNQSSWGTVFRIIDEAGTEVARDQVEPIPANTDAGLEPLTRRSYTPGTTKTFKGQLLTLASGMTVTATAAPEYPTFIQAVTV